MCGVIENYSKLVDDHIKCATNRWGDPDYKFTGTITVEQTPDDLGNKTLIHIKDGELEYIEIQQVYTGRSDDRASEVLR